MPKSVKPEGSAEADRMVVVSVKVPKELRARLNAISGSGPALDSAHRAGLLRDAIEAVVARAETKVKK